MVADLEISHTLYRSPAKAGALSRKAPAFAGAQRLEWKPIPYPARRSCLRHPAGPGVRGSELEITGSFQEQPDPDPRADRAASPQRPRHPHTGLETE